MPAETHLFAFGAYRRAKELHVNSQGGWIECKQKWVNNGGTWRLVFQKAFEFAISIPDTFVGWTTPGTYSFTVPSGQTQLIFPWIVGGGGAGGYGTQNKNGGGGGGGGSGGYLQGQFLAVAPGDTITIVIGQGGFATAADIFQPGGGGFVTVVKKNGVDQFFATGGVGGSYAPEFPGGQPPLGGTGGSPNGQTGQNGQPGTNDHSSEFGGNGGSTPWPGSSGGLGGTTTAGLTNGGSGIGPGAGGGGGGSADRSGAGENGTAGNGSPGGVQMVYAGFVPAGASVQYSQQTFTLVDAIQATGQWDGVTPVNATVTVTGIQGATNANLPAFQSGILPAGSQLTLIINSGAAILGAGGDGGYGGYAVGSAIVYSTGGTQGGPAIAVSCPTIIINNGTIGGGGGGGGGGEGSGLVTGADDPGSGGGGGGGVPPGKGGKSGRGPNTGQPNYYGSDGTMFNGGNPGFLSYSNSPQWQTASTGGAGGFIGQPGGNPLPNSIGWGSPPGGPGGAAVIGSVNVTWQVFGSVNGALE